MFYPYFTIWDNPGVSGKVVNTFRLPPIIYVVKSETFHVCSSSFMNCSGENKGKFNPYTEAIGGVKIGFKGYNYWFSEAYLIGKIIKWLFKQR